MPVLNLWVKLARYCVVQHRCVDFPRRGRFILVLVSLLFVVRQQFTLLSDDSGLRGGAFALDLHVLDALAAVQRVISGLRGDQSLTFPALDELFGIFQDYCGGQAPLRLLILLPLFGFICKISAAEGYLEVLVVWLP